MPPARGPFPSPQDGVKVLMLTFASPQYLANLHVDSGGRAAAVRNVAHAAVNGALAGLMNVLAKVL